MSGVLGNAVDAVVDILLQEGEVTTANDELVELNQLLPEEGADGQFESISWSHDRASHLDIVFGDENGYFEPPEDLVGDITRALEDISALA